MFSDLRELSRFSGFLPLILSRFISNVGNGLSPIALAYGVLSLKGSSGTALSLVMTARIAPMILFMLLGGVIGDRFKRNRIVGGSDVIGSLFAATSAISFIAGFANLPLLCLMGGLFGILNALWWPAMSGVLPEILPKDSLQKGNAVVGLLSNFGFVFGALVGGTVVTLYGSGWALLVDALSFLIAGLLVWNINLPPMSDREKNSMLHDLKIGWFEFISRSWVVVIVVCFTFMNLCFEATLSVLGPLAFNTGGHGPRNWSFNLAAITAGMIAGGLVSFKIKFSRPLVLGMIAIALVPGWIFSMGFQLPMGIILLGAFVAGVAVELFTVVWGTSMQTNIPEQSYSRVVSYDAFGSYALAPIGIAFAGPIANWIGVSHTLILAASVALMAALIPLMFRSVRELKYQMAK